MTRADKAAAIRDHVIQNLRASFTFEDAGHRRIAVLRRDGLMLGLQTPFANLDDGSWKKLGLPHKRPKAYILDVWAPKKVASFEWDDTSLKVISFRTGEWEEKLLALR